jgi:hypothetical protein
MTLTPPRGTLAFGLVEEHTHELAEGVTPYALGALDDAQLWWCVSRADGRFDTWIVGPGSRPRLVCEGARSPTEDAAGLASGLAVLAIHPSLQVVEDAGLAPPLRVSADGDWPVRRLVALSNERVVAHGSQESVPVWDIRSRALVATIDASTTDLLSFGAARGDPDGVLVAVVEPGPNWRGALWDVVRGAARLRVSVPTPSGATLEHGAAAVRPGTEEIVALLTHRQGEEWVTTLHRWAAGQHTILDERRGPAPAFTELLFVAPDWLMVMGHRTDALWELPNLTVRHGLRVEQVTPNGRARLHPRAVLDLSTGERVSVPGARGEPWCLHPQGERVSVASGRALTTWRLTG